MFKLFLHVFLECYRMNSSTHTFKHNRIVSGFLCDMTNQWCCPNIVGDPVGPCIRGEGNTRLCPDGYACSGPEGGQCYRLVCF